jgi:hypothetical protein
MKKSGFELTNEELRALMELRGPEGHAKVQSFGGPNEICRKLKTSPQNGIDSDNAD